MPDQLSNQVAQAQALRNPNASLGVPAQNYGQEIPGQQRGSPFATPAPTGMQTLNTPLDPNGGMQMSLPQQSGGPVPMAGSREAAQARFDQYAALRNPPQQGGQPPWARQGMGGYGQGGRFGMNPQMQGMPGQAATLRPQGTLPQPAGAGLPVTNQLAAPNRYGR